MGFVRFLHDGNPTWGVAQAGRVYDVSEAAADRPAVAELAYPGFRRRVRDKLDDGELASIPEDDVEPLAPVPRPGKIVCVGLNYFDHADEQDEEPPENPILFSKAPTAIADPGEPIVYPADSNEVDYEVELAAVIGKRARFVSAADAAEYVAGYTVLNDVSARDAQFADGQWFRGKSFDTFAPMGPSLVTGDAVDPNDLAVELRVNGDVKQRSSTAELIFDVHDLVEYITRAITLEPGDVISTGTPAGVGIFRDPPDLLEPGDVVEAEIEGIGVLTNEIIE